MSRLFTLSVPFESFDCPALVGLRTKGYDLFFFVHYLNKDVRCLIPQGNLEFSLSNGLMKPTNLINMGALTLVFRTVNSISNYLKQH